MTTNANAEKEISQGEWYWPAKFESDHHRFIYSVGKKPYTYVPYDNFDFTVTMLCGIPGSGKSSWIDKNIDKDTPIISLDDLRDKMNIEPGDGSADVVRRAKERAKILLRKQQSFVWDATNIVQDNRSELISLFGTYKAKTKIVYLDTPLKTAINRNKQRERKVPENIITKMFERLEIPTILECHRLEVVEVI